LFFAQWMNRDAADVMPDDADLAQPERVEQRQHIGGMLIGTERPVRAVASPKPRRSGAKR